MISSKYRASCACFLIVTSLAMTLCPGEEHDAGTWTTFSFDRKMSDSLKGNFVFQTRIDEDFSEVERYLLRPSLSWKSESGLVWTFGYDAHLIQSPFSRTEHRTWQQVSHLSELSPSLDFTWRFRAEERFLEGIAEVAVRPRFLVALKHELDCSDWYLKTSEEIFYHLNEVSPAIQTGYDQSRFFMGAGRSLTGAIDVEIGYQLQHINGLRTDLVNHFLMIGFSF